MDTLDSTLYLSNDDLFLLARGEWYRSYEKLGAHPRKGRGRHRGIPLCRVGAPT